MSRLPLRAIAPLLVLVPLFAQGRIAHAEPAAVEPGEPEDGDLPNQGKARSRFTFSFAGGAIIPRGDMKAAADGGLDIESRFGWTAGSGLGFVVNVEYALFRRTVEDAGEAPEESDASLFAATAAPRFTLGKQTVQVWIAAGVGVIMERMRPNGVTVGGGGPQLQTSPAVIGAGGVDLNLFGAAGLSVTGGYTRSVSDGDHDYFSINAGLVFSI